MSDLHPHGRSAPTRARTATKAPARAPRAQMLERLEARQLLAATAFLESTGRLVVYGTAGNDAIVISKDPRNAANLAATVNGVTWSFNNAYVKNVRVDAGDGNDSILTDSSKGAVTQPMYFLGANGDDTLVSTTGDDALIGAYGNDAIIATTGNNYVDAGPGADRTYTGLGNDTVVGAAAGDYVSDAGGANSISAPGATRVTAPIPATIAGVPQWTGTGTTTSPTPPTQPPIVVTPTPPNTLQYPTVTANNGNAKFVIGVWSQSPWRFATWKARGINTAIGYESLGGTVSVDQFSQYALDNGLMMIRHPNMANLAGEKKWTNLIGWMHGDEPDYHNIAPGVLQADYAKMKAAMPNMPVMTNFNGSTVLWGYGATTQATYQQYLAATDWVSQDLYPLNSHNRPGALDAPGQAAAKLAQWTNGKRQFAVIEASDQELPGHPEYPGPSADQFRAQVWNAVISGATGIIYFPQKIGGGFLWENMTPAVEAEMKSTNARLTRIGDALMTAFNPAGVTATASTGLRVTWRKYNGKTYLIALNNTNTTITGGKLATTGLTATSATVDGENRTVGMTSGQITDTFKPYEAHVYVVG